MSGTPSTDNLPKTEPSAGLLHSHRILRFAGPDAATFLQGYLTCDTDTLAPEQAIAGAFTNLKGRVVANGWVWGTSNMVLMVISRELTEVIAEFLKMYLNFSKTTLTVDEQAPAAHLIAAPTNAPTQGIPLGEGKWILPHDAGGDDAQYAANDISAQWLAHTIEHHEVLITAPTSGTLLPQMLGLTKLGAVSFDKGCYLGQEVVARAQHRGEVKRQLRNIGYSGDQPLIPGATLEDSDGKRVAIVINSTAAPRASTHRALIVTAVDDLAGARWQSAGSWIQLA